MGRGKRKGRRKWEEEGEGGRGKRKKGRREGRKGRWWIIHHQQEATPISTNLPFNHLEHNTTESPPIRRKRVAMMVNHLGSWIGGGAWSEPLPTPPPLSLTHVSYRPNSSSH